MPWMLFRRECRWSRKRVLSCAHDTHRTDDMDPTTASPEQLAEYAARDGFVIGFSEDRNKRCRKTMEVRPLPLPAFDVLPGRHCLALRSQDAHAFLHSFGGLSGQGFFAVYDGHAGKAAADWCGLNVHAVRWDLDRTHGRPEADSL